MSIKTLNREWFRENPQTGEEVRKFEERYSREFGTPLTISDFSLEEVIMRVEKVGFSADLVTQKVHDIVVRGAEDDEGLLSQIAKVITMSSEVEVVPIITPDDFKIYPGGTGITRTMGGVFDRVKLDCSTGKGLYKADLGFEDWWKKSNGYGAMEEALWAAGNAIMKDIIGKVIVDLETDKHSTMTNTLANWGNNHYKTLAKMHSLIRAQGMHPDFAVVNPDEEYDVMITGNFIDQDYSRVAQARPASQFGAIGYLYGYLPIFSHRGATAASMTMGCKGKSAIVGFYQPLTIEEYVDPREGLFGSVLSVQYDYKNGSNAEMTKGTQKSWAVATSA